MQNINYTLAMENFIVARIVEYIEEDGDFKFEIFILIGIVNFCIVELHYFIYKDINVRVSILYF